MKARPPARETHSELLSSPVLVAVATAAGSRYGADELLHEVWFITLDEARVPRQARARHFATANGWLASWKVT